MDTTTYKYNGKEIVLANDYTQVFGQPIPAVFAEIKGAWEANFPGLIETKKGTWIFQTSAHDCQFSDGTVFKVTEETAKQLKDLWSFLNVKREFKVVPQDDPGIILSTSVEYMDELSLQQLAAIHDCAHLHMGGNRRKPFFLVPFMVIKTLKDMGLRDRFPRLIAGNATKETQRSAPDQKIWDLDNMSY